MFLLGEPTKSDEKAGTLGYGDEYEILLDLIPKSLAGEVSFASLIRCHAGPDSSPTKALAVCPEEYLLPWLEKVKPKLIVAFGDRPVKFLTGQGRSVGNKGKAFVGKGNWPVVVMPSLEWAGESDKNAREFFAAGKAIEGAYRQAGRKTDRNYAWLQDSDSVQRLVENLKGKLIAYDYETTGLDPHLRRLTSVAFSWEKGRAACFDPNVYPGALVEILKGASGVVAHNAQFESDWTLFHRGFIPNITFDTQFAAKLKDENAPSGLKHLATIYTDVGAYCEAKKDFESETIASLWEYNCADADATLQVAHAFKIEEYPQAQALQMQRHLGKVRAFSKVRKNGYLLDLDLLNRTHDEIYKEIACLTKAIQESSPGQEFLRTQGTPVNPASSVHAKILFGEILKLRSPRSSKLTGEPSWSKHALAPLSESHPIAEQWNSRAELATLSKNFLTKLPELSLNGKVHPSWDAMGARTGRTSCSRPTIQNQANDPRIKRLFIAPAGYKFFTVDFSQAELRVAAHLSMEPVFIRAFADGRDLHTEMASRIFGVPFDQVKKEQRKVAKTINFGLLYGVSAAGLTYQIDLERSEAREMLDSYWAQVPKLKKWFDDTIATATRKLYSESMFGVRRHLPDLASPDFRVRKRAQNQAVNHVVQSSAADILLESFGKVVIEAERNASQIIITGQIHDSITGYAKHDYDGLQAVRGVANTMEQVGGKYLTVPLTAEASWGDNWYDQEAITRV